MPRKHSLRLQPKSGSHAAGEAIPLATVGRGVAQTSTALTQVPSMPTRRLPALFSGCGCKLQVSGGAHADGDVLAQVRRLLLLRARQIERVDCPATREVMGTLFATATAADATDGRPSAEVDVWLLQAGSKEGTTLAPEISRCVLHFLRVCGIDVICRLGEERLLRR